MIKPMAWFTFDSVLSGGAGSGMSFSNDNRTVSGGRLGAPGCPGRLASRVSTTGSLPSTIYTADTDPAFGIARIDVARDMMLGKDDKGFAMYIDRQRSWFQHNSIHERRVEGGISTGSTIGVLLDLERHTLHFIVNEMPSGVNRGVTLTLHTGLDAPHMDYH
ncbi:hypothetical protein quinque_009060 [Culex quinquefasciatus]